MSSARQRLGARVDRLEQERSELEMARGELARALESIAEASAWLRRSGEIEIQQRMAGSGARLHAAFDMGRQRDAERAHELAGYRAALRLEEGRTYQVDAGGGLTFRCAEHAIAAVLAEGSELGPEWVAADAEHGCETCTDLIERVIQDA